jgi:hypothetical protein
MATQPVATRRLYEDPPRVPQQFSQLTIIGQRTVS